MSEEQSSAQRRRYLIDSGAQMASVWPLLGVLLAVCVVEAVAVLLLSAPDSRGDASLATSAPLLLAIHACCHAVGAALLVWTVVRLTHRFVGPAHVMRKALAGMRAGEYGHRLNLRRGDFLDELAGEIRALREEIARRDVAHARAMHRLERALEEDDEPVVLESLRSLGSALPSTPAPRSLDRRSA